jgi:isopentenyl diphosphate isomerase/L-lactate dehydrogenase-like FMN-dependent dehydrogenase
MILLPSNQLNQFQESFAVFIDGGVRRGGDIFKAVALGAQALDISGPYSTTIINGSISRCVGNCFEDEESIKVLRFRV